MNKVRDLETQIFNRVNPAVKFSVTRYVLAIGIFVAIFAFGVVSSLSLGVDLLPSINIPVVNVSTIYTGSSPQVIDQQVTQIIENSVSSISGITDINSTSGLGFSRVSVSFDQNVDKNIVLQQVAAVVNAAVRRLPTGIQAPVVRSFDANSQPVIQFGVSGGGRPLTDVNDYVQNSLAPMLARVDGVANITFNGAPAREFQVLLSPDKLRFYNLNSTQVVTAITGNAINQPIGTITTKNNTLTFSTQNTPDSLEPIRKILVDTVRGIAVSDIAAVRDVASDQDYARINGLPVVMVSVQRTTDSNSVAVVDGVKKLLATMQLPTDYKVLTSNDTTGAIRASIDSTYRELFLTLGVVAIIILLFLGKPNTAFSVILAVPIALSASPVLYKLAGFSFNLVSLLAMVIAIGIVVDDSIVVAENVERYRKMGFSLKESVLKGASEVFSAVVAASLSLLSVLLPVSFMGGFIGRYLMQFALGLAAAVAFSLFEAILFLTVRLAYTPDTSDLHWKDFLGSFARPVVAIKWGFRVWKKGPAVILAIVIAAVLAATKHYIFLPALLAYPLALGILNYFVYMVLSLFESITELLHGWTESIVGKIRDAYVRSLGKVLKRSAVILVSAVVFLGAVAAVVVPHIPFNFVPNSDAGTMRVSVRFPPGTSQTYMNLVAAKVEAFLLSRKEVVTIQSVVSNDIEEQIQLSPIEQRPNVFLLSQTFRGLLQGVLREYPSARISVGAGAGGPGGPGGSNSMQLSMVSPNLDLLLKRNAAIVSSIQQNPYVADLISSLSDTSLEQDFVADQSRLKGTGITTQGLANLLQTYTSGTQAGNVVTGGLSYPIMVQIDPVALSGGQTLLDLPVYSSQLQTSLQVGQLGSFVLNEKPTNISRYNRQYTGSLNINLKPNAPTVLEMQTMIIKDLKAQGLLENDLAVTTNSRFGAVALAAQLASTGWQIFVLALFLAYLVMAAQFNSWRYPVYLLLPVPLAIIGALLLVWIMGGGLDIFGLMGMLMLIGLSAKNAILYLDFVVERLGKMPLEEALVDAARLRFRPIVMTTLTVLVISFPLILSGGQGSEFGQRMGMVMFGGIVFSAVLTFFVVPAAFYQFERTRQVRLDTGKLEIEHACKDVEQGILPPGLVLEGDGCEDETASATPIVALPVVAEKRRPQHKSVKEDEEYGI
jgi:HAE1 family hydrophobic/amphiphilic exporter-1